ncbi:MAG: PilC/PilY family type IV pilus protein [Betaproteobacteria bacterium]
MKRLIENLFSARFLLLSLALNISVALPIPAQAASVALATTPLATATTTTVQPNVLFILDDSGSMAFTYLPDSADDFRTGYGYHSSQCNSIYYNPSVTYLPPLDSTKAAYTAASFTSAYDNGFDSTSTARNLNSEFIANRFEPSGANSTFSSYGSYLGNNGADQLGPYGAFYYLYSGSQTTKNYTDTSSTFYTECNTAIGSATSVFSKRRLSTTETTTIVVSGTGTNTSQVTGITVNGLQIMKAASATAANIPSSTLASNIASQINFCTTTASGNCTTTGYSATVSSSTVTITGPTSAADFTPIISKSASMGTITLTTDVFPDTTAANLTNFANWYSFYRSRLLMMKTSAGRAFSNLDNKYRIGLMLINSSSAPTQNVATFESTQRSNWYSSLYNSTYSTGGTPLRKALSAAGRYYAGQLSTDPIQYSCQQNFSILATDGYWNESSGYVQLDGSTNVGNQDGTAGRPMNDGAHATPIWTLTYTRDSYSKVTDNCSGRNNKKLQTQPQIGSCSVTSSTASCTPSSWTSNGAASLGSTCSTTNAPSPTTPVLQGSVPSSTSSGGTSDTLADVAMYYYQTDLRTTALGNCTGALGTGEDVCQNNVFTGGSDNNLQQHMTSFTLGLGVNGRMNYSTSYLTDSTGDYVSVKLGSTASTTVCTWGTAGDPCTWPTPASNAIENIDDLWHAAVNGRGAYFSATDPTSLTTGLSNALAGINARKGSAAGAATSTLNPVSGNNFAFVASYTTVAWKGNLEGRGINTDTGVVNENASWCVQNVVAGTCASPGAVQAETVGDTTTYYCVTPNAVVCTGGVLDGTNCKVPVATTCTGTMNSYVSDTTDSRTIYTAGSTGTTLINFDSSYATANPANFSTAHINTLSQWTSLTSAQQTAASGVNLINYLRGQYAYEDRSTNTAANRLYRYREGVLGDALESQPAYIAAPVFSYPYPGYYEFKTAQASRAGTVYLGANDGMMHAFAADTGIERWAYVPSQVIPNMWKLADKNYATLHRNFVNGSPTISDICTANCSNATFSSTTSTADDPVWKTILVGGLNGGGRGYYALDITSPSTPSLLWEFSPTNDSDLGYSFGQPIITRIANGTWVVLISSGYDNGTLSGDPNINNSPAGSGKGFLYVLNASTGAVISKIDTGVGNATTPSGLAKIAAWNDEPAGNLTTYVYGGDLLGNLWRFNVNSTATAAIGTGEVLKFATLFSDTSATSPQPITTTPVLGKIVGKRVIFIGTGKYLETGDLTTTQTQSQYAIKDDNATTTLVNPRTTLTHQTLTNNPNGTATRLSSGSAVNFYTGRGWYFDFPDSGERVNINSLLVQGTLLIPSIVPSNTVCAPGGYGWLNYVDYKTGMAVNSTTLLAGARYNATIVGINVVFVDGNPKISAVTSDNPTPKQPPTQPDFPATAAGFTGKRVIWRELIP